MKRTTRLHQWLTAALLGSAAAMASYPAMAQSFVTGVATATAVPITSTSKPFNYRVGSPNGPGFGVDAALMAKYGYTEMEFFVSGTANEYYFAKTTNALTCVPVSSTNPACSANAYTSRILVRIPASTTAFSGNVVVEIYNGTPGYDADVEWAQTEQKLMRDGDAWVGLTNGTAPANVLKNDYGAYKTCGSSTVFPAAAPCTGTANRYTPINFSSAALTWDIINQTGALIKSNNGYPGLPASGLLPVGYTVTHLFAMAESGAAQTLVQYINDIHSAVRMPGGGPIFDGFMPDERFGTGNGLGGAAPAGSGGSVAAWPTCSPHLVLNSDVPIMNLETQPDIVSNDAWCVRRADSSIPNNPVGTGNMFRSWELAGSPHLTPLVTGNDNSLRDLGPTTTLSSAGLASDTPFVFPSYTCTHAANQSTFPKEIFKQASLTELINWAVNGTVPPPSPSPEALTNTILASPGSAAYVLDAFGNETGGLRTPFTDYPDRQWMVHDTNLPGAVGPLATLYCSLYGYGIPFTATQLQAEFANHGTYVKDVTNEVNQLFNNGNMNSWNDTAVKTEASGSPVPTARQLRNEPDLRYLPPELIATVFGDPKRRWSRPAIAGRPISFPQRWGAGLADTRRRRGGGLVDELQFRLGRAAREDDVVRPDRLDRPAVDLLALHDAAHDRRRAMCDDRAAHAGRHDDPGDGEGRVLSCRLRRPAVRRQQRPLDDFGVAGDRRQCERRIARGRRRHACRRWGGAGVGPLGRWIVELAIDDSREPGAEQRQSGESGGLRPRGRAHHRPRRAARGRSDGRRWRGVVARFARACSHRRRSARRWWHRAAAARRSGVSPRAGRASRHRRGKAAATPIQDHERRAALPPW